MSEQIGKAVRRVMVGKYAEEMRNRAKEFKEMAKKAVEEDRIFSITFSKAQREKMASPVENQPRDAELRGNVGGPREKHAGNEAIGSGLLD
ncbi:hypothetical protein RHMOL_Rhmol11G0239800 [Rhododendron molle]|uniref:Uncharacterized protein n=1 Tax=Rhododendron molle TaxID=49168 RepID=A0ACC0LXC1_RHOML|nr:hypothetical protein RHMOL_Rhmol11G0239800 [Rhododendron molle]